MNNKSEYAADEVNVPDHGKDTFVDYKPDHFDPFKLAASLNHDGAKFELFRSYIVRTRKILKRSPDSTFLCVKKRA